MMDELCKKKGSRFGVVLLGMYEVEKQDYIEFLKKSGIMVLDCVHPITPETSVAGEGHPNDRLNTIWAHCIGEAIDGAVRQ